MAKEPPNLHRIEELAARKAQDTIYQRLRALAEPVDVAGREGVMWGDIECLFAELRGERQAVVHATIRSSETAPPPPTMPRGVCETLTTNCPKCGEPVIEFAGDIIRTRERCDKCGWKA